VTICVSLSSFSFIETAGVHEGVQLLAAVQERSQREVRVGGIQEQECQG